MLIHSVVQKEEERNKQMILEYERRILELPKGSIVCRKNEYYYLKYREGGKIHDKYIGKDITIVEEVRNKLVLRRHYVKMLSALKKEQKAIHKILEGLV